jgi:hypothetical protein
MPSQNCRQHVAGRAAHIHDEVGSGEIAGIRHGRRLITMECHHGFA